MSEVPLFQVQNEEQNNNSSGNQNNNNITRTKSKRIEALDAFRGLTVIVMILVDNAGGAFPEIDHSPWNGITLADTVMPSFDFIVGCSVALSFSKFHRDADSIYIGFQKATIRFFKIFFLGMFTQGGKGIADYDMKHIRIMGILQRVAVCYYIAAICELYGHYWCCSKRRKKYGMSHIGVFYSTAAHWFVALLLCITWFAIMYGVNVPATYEGITECGYGKLTVPCNAQRVVDEAIFGVEHMYYPTNGGDKEGRGMTFQRMPECSTCSPGLCTAPQNKNGTGLLHPWCETAAFDPEGFVSQLTAAAGTLTGVHVGKVLTEFRSEQHRQRITHWLWFSIPCLTIGLILQATNVMPLNTDLFTISFLLVTTGMDGLLVCFWYTVTDIMQFKTISAPFIWVGKNALAIYVGAESGIIQWFLSIFYWDTPDNSLGSLLWPGVFWGVQSSDLERLTKNTYDISILLWTIGYIILWILVARWMHMKKIYIKI